MHREHVICLYFLVCLYFNECHSKKIVLTKLASFSYAKDSLPKACFFFKYMFRHHHQHSETYNRKLRKDITSQGVVRIVRRKLLGVFVRFCRKTEDSNANAWLPRVLFCPLTRLHNSRIMYTQYKNECFPHYCTIQNASFSKCTTTIEEEARNRTASKCDVATSIHKASKPQCFLPRSETIFYIHQEDAVWNTGKPN